MFGMMPFNARRKSGNEFFPMQDLHKAFTKDGDSKKLGNEKRGLI